MPLTQDTVNNAVNAVVNNFTNLHIAMPNGQYHGECTAPVVWYLHYMGLPIPPMHNNRADGWGVANPSELTPYFSFEGFNQDKAYPRGTILMWDSPHIAIVLGDSPGDNLVNCFEQNADPNGAPCKTASRVLNNQFHHCTHAMVPVIENPAPAGPPYSVEEIDPKQVRTNRAATKWGMNYDNLTAMNAHPILTVPEGTILTVVEKVHHHTGGTYYREANNVDGYNVVDCDDYTPPPPPPPASSIKDFQPLKPSLAPKVTLVADVPYYDTSTNARNKYKPAGQLPAGNYYQIAISDGMWNLSSDNTKDLQHWVNPKDNVVPPPAPAPAPPVAAPKPAWQPTLTGNDKATFSRFNQSGEPVRFVMEFDYTFTDLNGYSNKVVKRRQYDEVDFSGTFFHDNRQWARVFVGDLDGNLDMNRWFAIPMINPRTHTPFITPEKEVYNPATTPAERISLNHPTPYDKFIQLGANIDLLYSKAIKTIDGVFRPKK